MRWSLRQSTEEPQTCSVCGEPLRVERRRPGRRFSGTLKERRDAKRPVGSPRPAA